MINRDISKDNSNIFTSFKEFLMTTKHSKAVFAVGSSLLGFGLGYLLNGGLSHFDFYKEQQEIYRYFVDMRFALASLFPLLSIPLYNKLLYRDKSFEELDSLDLSSSDSSVVFNAYLHKIQNSSFPSLPIIKALQKVPSDALLKNSSLDTLLSSETVSDKELFKSIRSSPNKNDLASVLDKYVFSISQSDRSILNLTRLSFAYAYANIDFSPEVKESVWKHLSFYVYSELSADHSFLLHDSLEAGGTFKEARRLTDVVSVSVDESLVDHIILLKDTSSNNSNRFSLEAKINNLFYSSSDKNITGPLSSQFNAKGSSYLLLERAKGLSLYEALHHIGEIRSLDEQEYFFKSVYSKKDYFLNLIKDISFDRRDFDHYYLSLSHSKVSDKHISSILSSYAMMGSDFFKPVLDYHSLNLFIDFDDSFSDDYVLTKIDNGSIYVGSELTDLAAYVLINPILPVDSAYSFVKDELNVVSSLHGLNQGEKMDLFLQELFLRSYSLLSKDSINFKLKTVLQSYSLGFVDIALSDSKKSSYSSASSFASSSNLSSKSAFSMDFKDMFSLIRDFEF